MKKGRTIVFIITALAGIISIMELCMLFIPIIKVLPDASAVGVIGGADGPTAIFVAGSKLAFVVPVIPFICMVAGVVYLAVTKKKRQQ